MKTANTGVIKESPVSSQLNHQMNQQYIQEIGKKEFGEVPIEIEAFEKVVQDARVEAMKARGEIPAEEE